MFPLTAMPSAAEIRRFLVVVVVGAGGRLVAGTSTGPAGASTQGITPRSISAETPPVPSANLLRGDTSFELGAPEWCSRGGPYDDLGTDPIIDRTAAVHGSASARFLVEPEANPASLRIPLALEGIRPGATYCLSIWLRASSPHTVLAAISTGGAPDVSRWHVGAEWQRFHITFTMPTGPRDASAVLVLTAEKAPLPWILWLDAVKVESGSMPTDYQPADGPWIGVSLGNRIGLFHEGLTTPIGVGVQCPPDQVSGTRLRWVLSAGPNRTESGWIVPTDRVVRVATLPVSTLSQGWYRLDLELLDQSDRSLHRTHRTFGVIRPLVTGVETGKLGFRLDVPTRGPRSDRIARDIGLDIRAVGESETPRGGSNIDDRNIPSAGSTRPGQLASTPTSREVGRGHVGPPARCENERLAAWRIRELTQARATGQKSVWWPTAWDELQDDSGRWQPIAVALNVWFDVLRGSEPLRRLHLESIGREGAVFSRPDRTVAVVLGDPTGGRMTRIRVPLPAEHIRAFDLFGSPVTVGGGRDHLEVELPGPVVYLVAGPGLTRGRFALQLEDAAIATPTTTHPQSPRGY